MWLKRPNKMCFMASWNTRNCAKVGSGWSFPVHSCERNIAFPQFFSNSTSKPFAFSFSCGSTDVISSACCKGTVYMGKGIAASACGSACRCFAWRANGVTWRERQSGMAPQEVTMSKAWTRKPALPSVNLWATNKNAAKWQLHNNESESQRWK